MTQFELHFHFFTAQNLTFPAKIFLRLNVVLVSKAQLS